jgi:DNA modification methylase
MTAPYYQDDLVTVHHGDCVEVLRGLPDASVHAVVTDPPYGLEFMGKAWDKFAPLDFERWVELWAVECLRVLKPGGHLLAFGGSRTWHRLAAGIEDAGFEVRDSIAWLYGSGFPKSLDVSKAIDKAAGVTGTYGEPKTAAHAAHIGKTNYAGAGKEPGWERPWMSDPEAIDNSARKYEAGSAEAEHWQGWGTALKPAFEPIVVARKPLGERTVAANVLAHGTGALNIDGARVATDDFKGMSAESFASVKSGEASWNQSDGGMFDAGRRGGWVNGPPSGRWPANVVLDESQAAALDKQSGMSKSPRPYRDSSKTNGSIFGVGGVGHADEYGDTGGASRFFYVAKAPKSERPRDGDTAHPTVKPLDLMRWLVRLVTPPGGTVLEPFAGSGTTLEACLIEGFNAIGIEREETYLPLIMQRLKKPLQQSLFGDTA